MRRHFLFEVTHAPYKFDIGFMGAETDIKGPWRCIAPSAEHAVAMFNAAHPTVEVQHVIEQESVSAVYVDWSDG